MIQKTKCSKLFNQPQARNFPPMLALAGSAKMRSALSSIEKKNENGVGKNFTS